MNELRLILGLIAPWLAGYWALRALELRFNPHTVTSRLRQAGYGFFLGCALLQAVILANATVLDQVSFWPVLSALLLLSAAFLALGLRAASGGRFNPPELALGNHLSTTSRVLTGLLLCGAALHLVLAGIEVFNRPAFPWDAWLTWMYRAKAWFYSGQIFQLAGPTDWHLGSATTPFNAAGAGYPTLASIIPFWVATSLGTWHENLVNLPVLLCGAALGLALYGQCRESGEKPTAAAAAVYLLLSIPLLGTHLALAGQADIWMAGFTGLGFVALLRGLGESSRFQIGLGLLMTGLGMAAKNEGIVWFAAALLTVFLALRPRLATLLGAATVGLALLGWSTGITHMEYPVLGTVGLVNGALQIPFIGSYPVATFKVWDDYLDNFLLKGSWNLLWGTLLLGLLLLRAVSTSQRRAMVAFLLVLAGTQLAIFGFTEQGRWAEDSTAINRLPMHFAPALVFCLVAIYANWPPAGAAAASRGRLALAPLLAILFAAGGVLVYLYLSQPPAQAYSRNFEPQDFRVVSGGGRLQDGQLLIDQFEGGIAIATAGTVLVDAGQLPVLQVEIGGTAGTSAGFFWRLKDGPPGVESMPLIGPGKHIVNLSEQPTWRGKVSEVGLVFYQSRDSSAQLSGLSLAPFSLPASAAQMWNDWTRFERWTQASAHWIAGGARDPLLPLPLLALAWLLLTAVLLMFIPASARDKAISLCLCALVAWFVLDARWTVNSLRQSMVTVNSLGATRGEAVLDIGVDQQVAALVQEVREQLPATPTTLLVLARDAQKRRFDLLRAKYHLLPHAGIVHEGEFDRLPGRPVQYVLVLNPFYLEPGQTRDTAEQLAAELEPQLGTRLRVVSDSPLGTLFSARGRPDTALPDTTGHGGT